MTAPIGPSSKLFEPLTIGNGKIKLDHRVVLAPLTRNRGTPLSTESTPEKPNRVWLPNDLMAEYYTQRASKGGLIITEGVPPSLEVSGEGPSPVCTLKLPHIERRTDSVAAVPLLNERTELTISKRAMECQVCQGCSSKSKRLGGGRLQMRFMRKVAMLTFSCGTIANHGICRNRLMACRHSGRANIPQMTGTPIVSPSGLPWDSPDECFAYPPPHTSKQVRYVDNPPIELTVAHIKKTIQDYVRTARWAMECGFDGVEVHGGNGYLPEQFLASNVNKRTDAYGGSPEKRCTFTLELMEELSKAIGDENLAIRLSPFGLFNQIRCEQRMETWTTLCRKLKEAHPNLSYVSFIEPVSPIPLETAERS